MGRNTIGAVPKLIAIDLGLENSEKFTSHRFRRSSATALADSGATSTSLKRQCRWKSDTVALGCIDQSKHHKMDVAKSPNINSGEINTTKNSSLQEIDMSRVVNISSCSNVVINL